MIMKKLTFSTFVKKTDVKQTSIRKLIDDVLCELEHGCSILGMIPDYTTLKIVTMYDSDFDHVQIKGTMEGE